MTTPNSTYYNNPTNHTVRWSDGYTEYTISFHFWNGEWFATQTIEFHTFPSSTMAVL